MSKDESTTSVEQKQSAFFVGYLPFPVSLRNFYRLLIPLLLVVAVGASIFLAARQESTGNGVWNPLDKTTISGRLTLSPYPVLHTLDGGSVLLVVQGKRAADDVALPFDNQMVSVTGFEIRRGGWHMLEIPAENAIAASPKSPEVTTPIPEEQEAVMLQGEIVDSKCFLGVMKPGAGKVHRACAQLCLTGGLPPMLIVNDGESRYGYVLIQADGTSAARSLAKDVAVPVSVSGLIQQVGDLTYLKLDASPASVQRLVGTARAHFGESIAVVDDMPAFCGLLQEEEHMSVKADALSGDSV